jgi:hypothetical protein
MKKRINYSLIIACLFISIQSFCQTQTFDIATYTPPKDFKKDSKQGVVTYTHVNTTTGSFCIIAIYASTASAGDEKKDFNNEWKDLVVTPYKAEANPKTETQTTADGWKAVSGAAAIKLEGIDAYSILTVFSGFGKKVSVLANLNDQSYGATIDAVLENIKLDKTITTAPTNNTVTTQATGETGKFGSVIYITPKGWKEQQYTNGVVLTPTALPANEHLNIQLMQSMNFSGTMEQALQKSYDEACVILNVTKMHDVNGGNYNALSAKKSFRGWEYIRCSGGIQVNNGTPYKDEYGLDLFVVKINNRFERVAIVKSRNNCKLSRYYPSDRLSYNNSIEIFLFSLQFTDWQEPVVKIGTVKGDGIIGAWEGISMSVGTPKPGAILGADLKVSDAIFFSNGQAYFGTKFPSEGLDELDTRVRAENNRRDWGTYTFSNGQGVLKMLYGDIPLRIESNKLVVTSNKTDHGFIKLKPVDGATFNGTYALSELNGKIPSITFTADGRFTDDGAIKVLYHEYIDCINEALTSGSGTYEVKNYSIVFNYTDGRKIKIAFLGAGYDIKNQSPATLTLSSNEDELKRQ